MAADHELFFSRTRSQALKGADVALVIGVPMDFRLGFGGSFGRGHRDRGDRRGRAAAPTSAGARGRAVWGFGRTLRTCGRRRAGKALASEALGGRLRAAETERREAERGELRGRSQLRCTRCACTRSCRRCSIATRS